MCVLVWVCVVGCACTTECVRGQKITSVDSLWTLPCWDVVQGFLHHCMSGSFEIWGFKCLCLSFCCSSFSQGTLELNRATTTTLVFGSGDSNLSFHSFVASILSSESSPYLPEIFLLSWKVLFDATQKLKEATPKHFLFLSLGCLLCFVSKFKWRMPLPLWGVTGSDPPLLLCVRNSSVQVEKFQNTCPAVP